MKKFISLLFTHLIFAAIGFAGGIYTLPILMSPDDPTTAELASAAKNVTYSGTFRRDLIGSGFLNWGEGEVLVGKDYVSLAGSLSPGPDYRLYLSPFMVNSADEFNGVKSDSVEIGSIKTFDNFVVPVPVGIDLDKYRAVVVWCESFGMFISAARYR
ncbi:MAG: DM13 domain-containing protein [Gammaproteobacteria bacterium]|nr:DM13 domain-containing protein [Gammaproteobacteria bacterium]